MNKKSFDTSLLDKAMSFAIKAHSGVERKGKGFPYILHPMEAAAIAATITSDQEVLAAAVLHDVIEDTPTTKQQLAEEFGQRVADIVDIESDKKFEGLSKAESWRKRKEISIARLQTASREAKIVALGDKLSNMRAISRDHDLLGTGVWLLFNVKDADEHEWRFRGLAKAMLELEDTPAYQEFIDLINKVFHKTQA